MGHSTSTEMQDKELQNHSIWVEWALTFKQENAQTQVVNTSEPNWPFLMSKVMAGLTTESEAGASKKNICSDFIIIQATAYAPKPHFWSEWPRLMCAPLERSIRTVPKTQCSQLQVKGKRHLSHNSTDPLQLHNKEALRPHRGNKAYTEWQISCNVYQTNTGHDRIINQPWQK